MQIDDAAMQLMLHVSMTSRQGDDLFKRGNYMEAKNLYWKITKSIVGNEYEIPTYSGSKGGGVRCDKYIQMDPFKRSNLLGCYNGLAGCYTRENDLESAFVWYQEIEAVYQNVYYTSPKQLYDWMDYNLDFPELTFQRVKALTTSSDLALLLGNTALAFNLRWRSYTNFISMPEKHHTPAVKEMNTEGKINVLSQLRHPDPQLINKCAVIDKALQLHGSWARVSFKPPPGRVLARSGHSAFIWKSRFYLAGGRKDSFGPFYRDLWYLDLTEKAGSREWHRLPDYPITKAASGMFLNWNMLVYDDKVYLFTGRKTIDHFDLVTEKWGTMSTTFTPTADDLRAGVTGDWPYRGSVLSDATMQIISGKLLVFGGCHKDTNLGINLFMELNLKTRKWRRLSGYVMRPEDGDFTCPGPRKNAASWVGEDRDKFFLLYGHIDRQGWKLRNESHGGEEAFCYRDMWSWDLKAEKWCLERLTGNYPCSRTEMGFTYNEKLNKVVIFGGFSPSMTTVYAEKNTSFQFAYLADTFVYESPEESSARSSYSSATPIAASAVFQPKWRQVVTLGFPTYRCTPQLVTDEDTGKVYLFGGYVNSDFIPCRPDFVSKPFGDMWELRLDVPGGHFEDVNLKEELRTAKAGPYQRCFACGNAGPWRKCGGSCRGRAFFCGSECLKDGWKEHKTMHGCRKT